MGTAADPIGDSMDDDIQRRLDTFSRIWGRLDYKFIRVGIKPEHVQEYDLPEDPDEDTAKRLEENDSRTRRFKAKYGKLYAVELDALAGKEPEAFNQLVRNAVLSTGMVTFGTQRKKITNPSESDIYFSGICIDYHTLPACQWVFSHSSGELLQFLPAHTAIAAHHRVLPIILQ